MANAQKIPHPFSACDKFTPALAQPPENQHALRFAYQFEESLLNLIIEQLQFAYGEKEPMDKFTLAERLIHAVSGALPKIELSATTEGSGMVDLEAIVQELNRRPLIAL